MAKSRILVVEDEEDIQELVTYNLGREGYQTLGVASGEEALKQAHSDPPNLVLLDLMLPGVDGLEVCKLLKTDPKTRTIPIIMLTAKGEEADIVTGLELGADDYIPKPFSPKVLVARVRAVLRRHSAPPPDNEGVLRVQDLEIHPGRRQVQLGKKTLDLTFTEFHVLQCLARKPGWVFTRNQIVEAVRGDDYHVTERSVDVQIVSLRKKLGAAAKYIETVRGVGYRLKE
ncbi:MAG TPA: response regulator transcription factor [bacterium]|nr:response regulator transcription factor [bacterium]